MKSGGKLVSIFFFRQITLSTIALLTGRRDVGDPVRATSRERNSVLHFHQSTLDSFPAEIAAMPVVFAFSQPEFDRNRSFSIRLSASRSASRQSPMSRVGALPRTDSRFSLLGVALIPRLFPRLNYLSIRFSILLPLLFKARLVFSLVLLQVGEIFLTVLRLICFGFGQSRVPISHVACVLAFFNLLAIAFSPIGPVMSHAGFASCSVREFRLLRRCSTFRTRLELFYDFFGQGVNLQGLGLALARPVQSLQRLFGPSSILPSLEAACRL